MNRVLFCLILTLAPIHSMRAQILRSILTNLNVSSGAVTYLYRETFDGSAACGFGGYTNCLQALTYEQDMNLNYSTSPAPLQGAKSAFATTGGGNPEIQQDLSGQNEVWFSAIINYPSYPSSVFVDLIIWDSGHATLCDMQWFSNTQLFVDNTGGTRQHDDPGSAFVAGTTYYAKVRAKKGTGANAECQAYFSTNGSSWTAGTASNDGTWTNQPAGFFILNNAGAQTGNIFDDLRYNNSDISYP